MIKEEEFLDRDKLKDLIKEGAEKAYKYYTEEGIHEDGVDGFDFEACVEQQFELLYDELLDENAPLEMIHEIVEENKSTNRK